MNGAWLEVSACAFFVRTRILIPVNALRKVKWDAMGILQSDAKRIG